MINNVYLSPEELLTLRVILDDEVRSQKTDYYATKIVSLKEKMDKTFDSVLGFKHHMIAR